jgi:hypothetical protein
VKIKVKYKKIDGKIYKWAGDAPAKKSIAVNNAKFRRSKGQLSRVIKVKGGYHAFWVWRPPAKNAPKKLKANYRQSQNKWKKLMNKK